MATKDLLEVFDREMQCEYKGREYLVRDNGAICRLPREGGRPSKLDNIWSLGIKNPDNGYMIFASNIRVHQVVCTAFHGPEPQPHMVVDHIDTNRCNNRPENLRWLTRLENMLLNPITRAKIEVICGSIEAFLKNPALLYGHESEDPNFKWMRAVTEEEAKIALQHWEQWAAKPLKERKPKGKGVGGWIYEEDQQESLPKPSKRPRYIGPYNSWAEHKAAIEEDNERWRQEQFSLKDSLTPGAKQLEWKTPTEFLLCPVEGPNRTLQAYMDNLLKGRVFCRTQYGNGGAVLKCSYNPVDDAIYVLTHNKEMEDKGFGNPWALCKITLKDGFFVHENQGSFSESLGGEKYFTLAMGQEWTGKDLFDDYCQ